MKVLLLVLACTLWEVTAYPYPYYGANMDTFSYGSNDRGMVMSRYYNPYYNPRSVGAGMAAFMFKPEEQYQPQAGQYYLADRRRQTPQDNYIPPQQNEVFYPQTPEQLPEQPEQPELPAGTFPTELADPTEKTEISTVKATSLPELTEPEIEEVPEPQLPKKKVTKKKQVKRPVEEEDAEEEEQYPPRMPTGAFFPMFFGYGGRSGGTPSGATAIANAFSTGRGGVATSHATAYGPPRPDINAKL